MDYPLIYVFENSTLSKLNRTMDNKLNSSVKDLMDGTYELPSVFKTVMIFLYMVIFVISLGGNSLLCYIVKIIHTQYNGRVNYFLVSSAINDILMSVICVPFTGIVNTVIYWWPLGTMLCSVLQFMQLLIILHKSFIMVAIVCDQYNSISKPMKRRISRKKILTILIFCWFIPAAVAAPTAYYSTITYFPIHPGSKGLCLTIFPSANSQLIYDYSIMSLQYFIPLVVTACFYVGIGCIIWNNKIPGEADATRDIRIAKSKRKSIVIIVAMMIIFFGSWLPLHIVTVVGDADPTIYDDQNVHILWVIFHWLGLSNCGTNCIFYFLKSSTIKIELKRVFSRMACSVRYMDINILRVRSRSAESALGDVPMTQQ